MRRSDKCGCFKGQRLVFSARILLVVAGMHGRTRSHFIGRLRHHAISKICAAWFIVLILLPFTAPFPTYHFDHHSNGFPYDALPKDVKNKSGSDDEFALPSNRSAVPATFGGAIVRQVPALADTPTHPPHLTVLRL
jgi:hypothetical protein